MLPNLTWGVLGALYACTIKKGGVVTSLDVYVSTPSVLSLEISLSPPAPTQSPLLRRRVKSSQESMYVV